MVQAHLEALTEKEGVSKRATHPQTLSAGDVRTKFDRYAAALQRTYGNRSAAVRYDTNHDRPHSGRMYTRGYEEVWRRDGKNFIKMLHQ